jgi:hypothetical protein
MRKMLILATAAPFTTSNASDTDSSSILMIHVHDGAGKIGFSHLQPEAVVVERCLCLACLAA